MEKNRNVDFWCAQKPADVVVFFHNSAAFYLGLKNAAERRKGTGTSAGSLCILIYY